MTSRVASLCMLLLATAAAPGLAAAQERGVTPPPAVVVESLPPSDYPWLLSYYPLIGGGLGGGPVLVARARYFQPSPYESRSTYRADVTAEGGLGLHGSRRGMLRLRAPLLTPDMRLNIRLAARRNTRENFFGLGNNSVVESEVPDDEEFRYRVEEIRYQAIGDITRRIAGPLLVSARGGVENIRYLALPGPTLFADTYGGELTGTDAFIGGSLVLDTRNNEFDPTSGFVLESGANFGSGGDGYSRLFGMARGYRMFGAQTLLAARIGASQLYGDPPLSALYELPAWEDVLGMYGGGSTNRGLRSSRYLGTGVIFGNIELRRELFTSKNAASVSVLGFVDAGRVFQGQKVRLTTEDIRVGGGVGLALQILRSTNFIFDVAWGPDGMRFNVGSGWAF
ncbi:MAG TPA: BamA/TamA family outer membrane protein [Gemmatimonadales bacterium]|nr:BamA/TamA family outer membrane protein [Gemmatimonadales bacterium]